MSVICSICARAGSKGLKNKNIKILKGKPLIAHTITQAVKSKIFDEVVVSTDSKQIQKIAKKYGANCWFLRSKKLSGDNSPKIPVIKDLLLRSESYFKKNFQHIVDLDPTSPLRSVLDIKKAYQIFKKKKANLLITGCEASKNPYFNMYELNKFKKAKIVKQIKSKNFISRQTSPKVYEMNASIYIWNRQSLLKSKQLFLKNTITYTMPKERSIDIDSKLDWDIVNILFKK